MPSILLDAKKIEEEKKTQNSAFVELTCQRGEIEHTQDTQIKLIAYLMVGKAIEKTKAGTWNGASIYDVVCVPF